MYVCIYVKNRISKNEHFRERKSSDYHTTRKTKQNKTKRSLLKESFRFVDSIDFLSRKSVQTHCSSFFSSPDIYTQNKRWKFLRECRRRCAHPLLATLLRREVFRANATRNSDNARERTRRRARARRKRRTERTRKPSFSCDTGKRR